jgi:glycosyltransferase involved in cell wall biosynthesis
LEAARAFVRAARPDVVHVHDGMLWEFAISCGPARRVFTPHVVHRALNELRGIDEPTLSLRGQCAALDAADVVIAPSEAAARMLGRASVVAPLGVAPPPTLPREHGPPTVLHVGRFDAAKGTDDLIAILGAVSAAVPGARCEIAGGIPENPKADRRRRRRIEAQQVPGLSLLGWLGGAELEAAYARADVLLQPSRLETVGLAVLEGMARGLPVVTTRCGGPEEMIIDARSGRLLGVGDIQGAADATIALLVDPARRRAMGSAAREAAASRLWPRVVDRWLDAYRGAATA